MHTKMPVIPRSDNTRLGTWTGSHTRLCAVGWWEARNGWRIVCVLRALCSGLMGCLPLFGPAQRRPSIHLIGGPIQRNTKKQAASRPQLGNLASSYCARLSPLLTPAGQTRLSPNQPALFTARPHSLQGTPHTLACGGLNGQLPSLTAIQHHHLVATKLTRSPISSPISAPNRPLNFPNF